MFSEGFGKWGDLNFRMVKALFNRTRFFFNLGKDDVFLKVSGGPVGQYLLLYSSSLFLLKYLKTERKGISSVGSTAQYSSRILLIKYFPTEPYLTFDPRIREQFCHVVKFKIERNHSFYWRN